MKYNSLTIAKFTLIEAFRNKNLLFLLSGLAVLFALAEFTAELAITESTEMSVAWLVFCVRVFLVAVLSLFILTSLAREFDDKVMLHIFSHAIQRHVYYTGKLFAFAALALFAVVCTALLLLMYLPLDSVAVWSVSFYSELLIVVALTVLFFFTFKHTVMSFISVMAFYLLARNIATIQLISSSPLLESVSLSSRLMKGMLDIIHAVLPALYEFSQTAWLIYDQFQPEQLLSNILQCLIYVLLLASAALFDLYRMEF